MDVLRKQRRGIQVEEKGSKDEKPSEITIKEEPKAQLTEENTDSKASCEENWEYKRQLWYCGQIF